MVESQELDAAVDGLERELRALFAEADAIARGPAADGDDENDPLEARGRAWEEEANRTMAALEGHQDDPEARAQITALLGSQLASASRLLAEVEPAPDGAAADGVSAQAASTAEVVSLLGAVRSPDLTSHRPASDGTADGRNIPEKVTAELDQVQDAATAEIIALAGNAAVRLVPAQLAQGLSTVLTGGAKQTFDAAIGSIQGIWKWVKRWSTKIVAWVTDQIEKLLPAALREKVEAATDELATKLKEAIPEAIGGMLGRVFGRGDAETRWTGLAPSAAVTAALALVETATDAQLVRIGWVTKGREATEEWLVSVVLAVLNTNPWMQVAYGAAVAALFAWILYQLWDGIDAVGDLVPSKG